jgi:protein-glucosylgalactosylhydroxylysine glucosidase
VVGAWAVWDVETWMFPAIVLWFPALAQSLLQYRFDRLEAAYDKARSYDPPYKGSM